MADYEIYFTTSAYKELEALESTLVEDVYPRIVALAKHPRPKGCLKLKGSRHLWRIKVKDYRVVYTIDDDRHLIEIIAVRHRRDAY